jgi:hypothetical protein
VLILEMEKWAFSTGTGQTRITRARFVKSGTTATLSQFRLHLYEQSPVCANGDNGAWSTSKAANYLGNIDGPTTLFPFTTVARCSARRRRVLK